MGDALIYVLVGVAAFLVGAVICGFICFKLGIKHRIKTAEAQFESAEKEAARIIAEANEKAATKKKTALVEAKDEIHKLRSSAEKEIQHLKNDTERELKERRSELSRSERRLQQKEETLDRKIDACEHRERNLNRKEDDLRKKEAEIEKLNEQRVQELERISGLSKDQAKKLLLDAVESDVKIDAAKLIKGTLAEAKDDPCEKCYQKYIFTSTTLSE